VLDEAGMDLLLKLLTYDPTQRISAIKALEHEYFKDMVVV
jgi:cyclin-dependent kinase 2